MDDVGSIVEPTSSLAWADVIHADFQRVISRYIQNISTCISSKAQLGLRTIFIQKSKPKYAHLPSKIIAVWIDRFCVRYAADVVIYIITVAPLSHQRPAILAWNHRASIKNRKINRSRSKTNFVSKRSEYISVANFSTYLPSIPKKMSEDNKCDMFHKVK